MRRTVVSGFEVGGRFGAGDRSGDSPEGGRALDAEEPHPHHIYASCMTPNSSTDWLEAIAAWIAALSGVGTLLLTGGLLYTALLAYHAARDTLQQMRADSEAQREDSARATRPYVFARLMPGLAGHRTWDIAIENTGQSAAYDLKVEIDADRQRSDIVATAIRSFAASGAMIPPGGRIRAYWYVEADRDAEPPDVMGYPRATVTLNYADSEGHTFNDRPIDLDPELIGLTPVPHEGDKAHGADEIQRDTVHALRSIARHLGELHR